MKQYIKIIDGQTVIKERNNIIIRTEDAQILNPSEEMVLADGWEVYTPPTIEPTTTKSRMEVITELVEKQWNDRTDISNEEALDYMVIVYPWSKFIGQELAQGKIVSHDNKLWRVIQTHTVLDVYAPSLELSSLYEVIEKEHTGAYDDPIPYTPPMEIFMGKYYTQDGVKYLCTRDSSTALSHNLADLVGLYVEQSN